MSRPRFFGGYDWWMALGALLLLLLLLWCMSTRGRTTSTNINVPAASGTLGFTLPNPNQVPAGVLSLSGTGVPGETLEIYDGDFNLGRVVVGPDGKWALNTPPYDPGEYTFQVRNSSGGTSEARYMVVAPTTALNCTDQTFSLANLSEGQTVTQPFRFGGVGPAPSYTVRVRRGDRVIGSVRLARNSVTCGWKYDSRPGVGPITYEVRESSASSDSEPLQTINLTVQ